MGPQVGWGGVRSQGITKLGQKVLARLMETQIWHLPVPAGKGLNRGAMASASTSVWEKAAPPALASEPDNSVPPCPWHLLSCCPSAGALAWPLMRDTCEFQSPPTHSAIQVLLVFTVKSYGDISSWHWNPRLRGLM